MVFVRAEPLTVKETATGYWFVQRGAVELVGAITREAAEAERELILRLRERTSEPSLPREDGAPGGS